MFPVSFINFLTQVLTSVSGVPQESAAKKV
jgi:hypothetical protein